MQNNKLAVIVKKIFVLAIRLYVSLAALSGLTLGALTLYRLLVAGIEY